MKNKNKNKKYFKNKNENETESWKLSWLSAATTTARKATQRKAWCGPQFRKTNFRTFAMRGRSDLALGLAGVEAAPAEPNFGFLGLALALALAFPIGAPSP